MAKPDRKRQVAAALFFFAAGQAFVGQPLPATVSDGNSRLGRREGLLLSLAPLLEVLRPEPAFADSLAGKKVVVLGGSGFVGQRICEGLVAQGAKVVSLSRSGAPNLAAPWASQVSWQSGDVLSSNLDPIMNGAEAVISAIGTIGTADDETGNGATNEAAAKAAKKANAKRFVLVSASKDVAEAGVDAIFGPYVKGKRRAETAVANEFGANGVILQPSFIYGGEEFSATPPRVAGWYGEKVESLLSTGLFRSVASASPAALRLALSPPLAVEDVAAAAVAGAAGVAQGTLGNHDAIKAAR